MVRIRYPERLQYRIGFDIVSTLYGKWASMTSASWCQYYTESVSCYTMDLADNLWEANYHTASAPFIISSFSLNVFVIAFMLVMDVYTQAPLLRSVSQSISKSALTVVILPMSLDTRFICSIISCYALLYLSLKVVVHEWFREFFVPHVPKAHDHVHGRWRPSYYVM